MKRHFIILSITIAFSFFSGAAISWAGELFPFVISFDAPENATNISQRLHAPAGKHGFIRVENGHFANDQGRIRFWGTNTCFGANFLEHEMSDRLALRLARFGINCVRLHHMDMHDIWGGYGAKTQMEFDKEQLDKLDYFIAALKKRGIYVNINLHVSRSLDERDGFPKNENRPSHDKGIDNYYRPFIEANKKYAKDLLTHVNPYTGTAYKDEPAVAMIEINNENSIITMWGGWGGLEVIQDPFLGDLRKRWNDWLKTKYENDAALKKAWNHRAIPLGREMLKIADFSSGYVPDGAPWNWETDEETDAPLHNQEGVLRMDVRKKGKVDWRPQLIGTGISVKKDQIYTLQITAKANRETSVNLGLRMNHDPWEGLGFDTSLKLTPQWKTFRFTVSPDKDDENARISFGGLKEGDVYELKSLSLKPGGTIGLGDGESLSAGNIPVLWKKEIGNHSKEMGDDFFDFLLELEAGYWDEMYRFLKEDIKVRQPVSGTQLEYGSTFAQAKMDYCDIHAYWNHPVFPGRPWDGSNWFLRNRSLVNSPDRDILPNLATKRVAGKPFTVSEYNHPYPNRYAGEGLPILAAFGAFQDWDGIFPFAYSHSNNIEPKMAGSFFDTAGNTVQMAHMIACSSLFHSPIESQREILVDFSEEKEREIFHRTRHPYGFGFSGLGVDPRFALIERTALRITDKLENPATFPELEKRSGDSWNYRWKDSAVGEKFLYFSGSGGKGRAGAYTGRAALFTGFPELKTEYPLIPGEIALRFDEMPNLQWATASLAKIEKTPQGAQRYLFVITGEMLNTDMNIESLGEDRITVSNRWGKPPVRCEGVAAKLLLKNEKAKNVRCWALDESGRRKTEITEKAEKVLLEVDSKYKTIWYEIEIGPEGFSR